MPLFEITKDAFHPLRPTTFAEAGLRERDDLQRLLRDHIAHIAPGTLVLSEEFGEWDQSQRRIDLLLLDADANLVVCELKRTLDGGAMELQALRYAAMVSTMTFDQAVNIHQRYLDKRAIPGEARSRILSFLQWDIPYEDDFAQDVRIVLASADFSKELTTAVLWLNDRGLDIRCVRLQPYADGERVLVDVQQVIPLPEAEEFRVRVREKAVRSRATGGQVWDAIRLLSAIEAAHGVDAAQVARQLIEWGAQNLDDFWWGSGAKNGKCVGRMFRGDRKYLLYRVTLQRGVVIPFQDLAKHPPFDNFSRRRDIADRISAITQVPISDRELEGLPATPYEALTDAAKLEAYLRVLQDLVGAIEVTCAE